MSSLLVPKTGLPFFSSVPWDTDAVINALVPPPEYNIQGVVDLIQAREANMFKGINGDSLTKELIELSTPISAGASALKGNNTHRAHSASFLLLYRVLDVACMLQGYTGSQPPSCNRQRFPELDVPHWKEFTSDWPRFLRQAGILLHTAAAEPSSSNLLLPVNAPLYHWQSICRRIQTVAHNKSLINFEVAAMYLSTLIKGCEFPDQLEDFAKAFNLDLASVTSICARSGVYGLRLPLQLALAVSPCVLFLPMLLHKCKVPRIQLLEVWQGLGSSRPPMLTLIERTLWRILFEIATDHQTQTSTISRLLQASVVIEAILAEGPDPASVGWFEYLETMETDDADVQHGPTDAVRESVTADPSESQNGTGNKKRARSPSGTGTRDHPIDLTGRQVIFVNGALFEVEDLTDDREGELLTSFETDAPRVAGPSRILYDAFGNSIQYAPSFHHKKDLDTVTRLIDRVEQDYHSSHLPMHVADPEKSIIRRMTIDELEAMNPHELQQLHAQYHLLVTGFPEPTFGFDSEGMSTLCSPSRVFAIQDHSIKPTSNQNTRIRQGTVQDLLKSYQSSRGKILNSLDFPMYIAQNPPLSLASDLASIRRRAANEPIDEPFPTAAMRWGLCATAGAFTMFHIDADGLSTYISCVNEGGSKWWVLVGPKDVNQSAGLSKFESMFQFHNSSRLDLDVLGDVQVEAILLTPGTRLFMRPNTPHAVLTPTATICHGGHYFMTRSLRRTCHGYLMSFVLSTLITNTEHTSDTQTLFRHMIADYHYVYIPGSGAVAGPLDRAVLHVPDVRTFDGILDLFSLCNLIELANVAHPETYTKRGLCTEQRKAMIHARSLSREVVSWVFANYEFENGGNDALQNLYWMYLAMQARAICHGKEFGDAHRAHSYTQVALAKQVRTLVTCAFKDIPEFWQRWHMFPDAQPQTFAWPEGDRPEIKTRSAPEPVTISWRQDGRNEHDLQWEEALKNLEQGCCSPRRKRSRRR